jgi:YggT family protein
MRRKGYIGTLRFGGMGGPGGQRRQAERCGNHCPSAPLRLPVAKSGWEFTMTSIYEILMLILGIAKFFVFAHFIMSWLINFQVLNIRQPLVSQIWYGLNRLLEPLYGPIRRILPSMGGLDLSPLVLLIAIYALEIILTNNIALFL